MLDKIYTANIHVAYICVTDYSGLKQLGRWQAASKHWEVSVNIKADCSHGPQGTACVKEEQDRTFKLPSFLLFLKWHIQCLQRCFSQSIEAVSWQLNSLSSWKALRNFQKHCRPCLRTSSDMQRLPFFWHLLNPIGML